MRSSAILLLATSLLAACGGDEPEVAAEGMPKPAVSATGPTTLRVAWPTPEGDIRVRGFQLERRRDFTGAFTPVGGLVSASGDSAVVIDDGLEPDVFYGYRFRTVGIDGSMSGPSLVGGGKTSPAPGVFVVVSTTGPPDADGYTIALDGPEKRVTQTAANSSARFAALPLGDYAVTLRGIAAGCRLAGDSTRAARSAILGPTTVDSVRFDVTCRDASKGGIVLRAGTTRPGVQGQVRYRIEAILGQDVFVRDVNGSVGQGVVVDGLAPGRYDVALRDVPEGCSAEEPARRSIDVVPLGLDTLAFSLDCDAGGGGEPSCTGPAARDPAKPYALRSEWSAPSAAPGAEVELLLTADLGTAGTLFGGLQYRLEWDASRLEFLSGAAASGELLLSVGPPSPGSRRISVITVSQVSGVTPVVRARFRVLATAAPGCVSSRTGVGPEVPGEFVSSTFENLLPGTQVIEAELQVTAGGSGGTNQPPVARPGGPYSGTVGVPVAFSGTASSDADGTIVSYNWNPGDGGSPLTGPTPSKSYGTAGSFTVTLTVTDDAGATAVATTTVTITAPGGGGGGNQPPVARPGGPYTAQVGVPMALDGSASSDPDGSIASFSWAPGGGLPALTGPRPTATYTVPGTYSVTLTVTDNAGATASAVTTVIVSAGPSGGIVLRGAFQPGAVAGTIDLIVTLDLTSDLAATPGPEVLQAWGLSQLAWNDRVLRYRSITLGRGWAAVSVQVGNADALTGIRALSVPLTNYTGSGSFNTGLVQLARISFDVVGAPGTTTTTVTVPSALLSPGGFSYTPLAQIIEATYQRP